ncbi:CRP/FNR family transcriptional regulator, anaerobic regulatory protein [Mesobacillus persicus]|uniref:CRP/FNR family transcriptional regulator, anaerobic regulatory protein n=1 Tax=Mesobacillus persicus TaxID=930146 RepID=A0A1H8GJN1_9BACI|nr:Crp/Fnr family transcriptional regulator [Mesobacillus persicus]SEN44202.1 CRP/FNR family transcriptional regulator, anaerobic regulatory protein [Mesobacillus persicus]
MKEHSCTRCDQYSDSGPCPRKVPIFISLSDKEILKITRMVSQKQFKKGQALIHEGEKSDKLFIINKGQVKRSKFTVNGKEQILDIMTCGDFFGEMNLFNTEEVNNFTAYAIDDTEICVLTKDDIDVIMSAHPDIAIKLLKEVTRRLAHTENLAQSLATKDPEVRIAQMIVEYCDKFGTEVKEGILISLPITREEIASYVGVTRETISRKLGKFEDLGLISLVGNKKILVKDERSLIEYIE